MFVVPCKFNPSVPHIFNCVNSISENHPKEKIIIVDSDSEDKTYFSKIERENVEILDIKNRNYVVGAFWAAVNKYDKEEDVYLLHDSMILKKNISFISDSEVTSIRYFRSWFGVGGIFPTGKYHYGYDSEQQLLWSIEEFKKINIDTKISYFNGVFGSSFFCKKNVVEKLKDLNFHKILPVNKWQDQAMERNLGVIFSILNFNHIHKNILGEHHENPYENEYIRKIISGRQ